MPARTGYAALGAAGLFAAGTARAATTAGSGTRGLPYPPDVTDTSHCTHEAAEIFRGFFTAKSEHDAAGLMSYFSKANTTYIDACLWRDIESYLAANPGLFCFVRLAYPRQTSTDVPDEVEYGVMAERQFCTVIFPNS